MEVKNFAYWTGINWYGFIAWAEFFQKIGVKMPEIFEPYLPFVKSGQYDMVMLNGFCIVSKMPVELHRNNLNRLHSIDGPAIAFNDAYKLYFIHGVHIDINTWQKLQSKTFTFEDFIKESNEEIKSASLAFMEEKWGSEFLFRFISDNLKEIDTHTEKKEGKYMIGTTGGMNIGVYTLFKGNVNNINLAFVRCYCPSSDRMFFLSVSPENKNAKDAIASLYRIPRKLKEEIKYIQRQGERFSTVLTDTGKQLVKTLSKEDLEDLTHISGKQYFSQLTYEY